MAFSLPFTSDFGCTFPNAYAAVINMSWSGGDIDVLVAIYADEAAFTSKAIPVKHLPLTVPVSVGVPILSAIYDYLAGEVTAGSIPALTGAVVVP